MKKFLLVIAVTSLICSCGGGSTDSKKSDKDSISTEVKELQKSSDEIKTKSDELNKKADSLLNNI
jgi:outer membrane murein-binding lipoprotein Lpp